MDRTAIESCCREKADELLERYFPDFINEAAVIRPEKLAAAYHDDLPREVQQAFREWLASLWEEIAPAGAKSFPEIMNLHKSMQMVDISYVPYLKEAREKAEKITLRERITRTNHKDVTFYKGLLKQYTEELLQTMIQDFMGDVGQE